jgi:hypothetical protein
MAEASASYRVVYVGTGRQPRRRFLGSLSVFEPERDWRQRLAQEMEAACQEMARRGLRLVDVVPALSAESMKGSWTEGVWLYFESAG